MKKTSLWLLSLATLIIIIIVIGAITRLTGSGLSMVTWKPLIGTLPPPKPTTMASHLPTLPTVSRVPKQPHNNAKPLQANIFLGIFPQNARPPNRPMGRIPLSILHSKKSATAKKQSMGSHTLHRYWYTRRSRVVHGQKRPHQHPTSKSLQTAHPFIPSPIRPTYHHPHVLNRKKATFFT